MKKKLLLMCLLFLLGSVFLNAQNYGDVNGDGSVDVVDALQVARFYVGLISTIDENIADVDADNSVTIVDALWICRYFVGLVDKFPAEETTNDKVEVLASSLTRNLDPQISADEMKEIGAGINQFGYEMYQQIKNTQDNVFFSPVSISYAFAMCSAGAKGNTKTEIIDTLNFPYKDDVLHNAYNSLELEITTPAAIPDDYSGDDLIVRLANSAWGQKDYYFVPGFLDILAVNYGAGMNLVDFINAPDPSRFAINEWVAVQTEDMIQDLLPAGSIDSLTRLVLTNAIYFKAQWVKKFHTYNTNDDSFYNLDGSTSSVPMMHQEVSEYYYNGNTLENNLKGCAHEMLIKSYQGTKGNALFIFMPAEGQFESFEKNLNAELFNTSRQGSSKHWVTLTMPKFDYSWKKSIKPELSAMGMSEPFTSNVADFSGLNGNTDLYISDVLHEAAISVDEEGTEASAATTVIIPPSAPPDEATMNINRPFIYIIRNFATESILFMGKVTKL